MQKIRVLFEKRGAAKYISHLDLVRVVGRAIKRAEIPIVYSQGFNPVPKMNFALPLSLGQESVCEILNFRVEPEMPCGEIKKRLSENLPDGLVIKDVYVPEEDADLFYAGYEVTLRGVTKEEAEACFARDEIVVVKKTKSSEKPTDIKPFIKEFSVKSTDGGAVITCVLSSKDPCFLNAEYLVKALSDFLLRDVADSFVLRTEVYTEDMKVYR